MKILHILPDIHTGGSQKFCIDLCNELAKDEKNEIILCTIDKVTKQQDIMLHKIAPNIQFLSLNKKSKNPIIFLKIIKMIFSIKPDITHTHTRAQAFSALAIILYGNPNIHTIHSMADKETSKGRLRFYKFLYKFFNFTPVSISDKVLQSAKTLYGDEFNTHIDNGTEKIKTTEKFEETKQFIDFLKKDDKTKFFVSIGRFYNVKNQELLINAFEQLLDDGIDAHLLILGSLDVVPSYAKLCKEKIKTHSRIHVLGEKENIADYLTHATALCFSSIYEGFPIAIIEAMSIGIPTVATPVGGMLDIVINKKTGYLSKDMKPNSYKEILLTMINDTNISSKELINHYKKHYTMQLCSEKYTSVYRQKIKADNPLPRALSNL